MAVKIYQGHVLDVLKSMGENSVHVVITSPPYWGLRDYGTESQIWGGDPDCEHIWQGEEIHDVREETVQGKSRTTDRHYGDDETRRFDDNHQKHFSNVFCVKCGAWSGSLGLEPTPELYVRHLVNICGEIRRVLRKDGTLWLNLGDSYAGSGKGQLGNGEHAAKHGEKQHTNKGTLIGGLPTGTGGLKPKDMVGIPWRVAFALQADGWWLRSDIIWAKGCSFGYHEVKCPHCGEKHQARYSGSCMPESVRDRPTSGHEHVFLLSKSKRYFYDYYGVKEAAVYPNDKRKPYAPGQVDNRGSGHDRGGGQKGYTKGNGRNVRTVWQINSAQFPQAHYAVFPEELIDFPIRASTSEYGCCSVCGAPWYREKIKTGAVHTREPAYVPGNTETKMDSTRWNPKTISGRRNIPSCECSAEAIPCTVLDPFGGRGTTAVVAEKNNCNSIIIDLSPEYVKMSRQWISEQIPGVEITTERINSNNE